MIKTTLLYKGDYAREFGHHKDGCSRVWSVHDVWDGDNHIGFLEIEPEYHSERFKVHTGSVSLICSEFVGAFNTKREALKALVKARGGKQCTEQ